MKTLRIAFYAVLVIGAAMSILTAVEIATHADDSINPPNSSAPIGILPSYSP